MNAIYSEILIPPAGWDEVDVSDGNRSGAREVASAKWIRVVHLSSSRDVFAPSSRLDLGEREAIALAEQLRLEHPILSDDQLARRFALARGIEVIGSAGLLLRMKRRGLIHAVRPLLDQRQDAGLYLSDGLYNELLAQVDEQGPEWERVP